MWVWEVEEVVPIHLFIIKPLGVTSTLLILLCYARKRGLGLSEIHDRCESYFNWITLRWQL